MDDKIAPIHMTVLHQDVLDVGNGVVCGHHFQVRVGGYAPDQAQLADDLAVAGEDVDVGLGRWLDTCIAV